MHLKKMPTRKVSSANKRDFRSIKFVLLVERINNVALKMNGELFLTSGYKTELSHVIRYYWVWA